MASRLVRACSCGPGGLGAVGSAGAPVVARSSAPTWFHQGVSVERAEAVIDLDAVRANTHTLLQHARRSNPAVELMAVVKADGYGHGAVPVARTALRAGAGRIGVATPDEAVALRSAGVTAPVLCWLWTPEQDIAPAVAADVTLTVSSAQQLAAARRAGARQVHLKVDTGLGRGGSPLELVSDLLDGLGDLEVTGLMSHLANADEPGDPSVPEQIGRFHDAVALLHRRGHRPVRHLANTPGTLLWPDAVLDLVRCGIGLYGVDPLPPGHLPVTLRPAMTLQARVALVKRVPAGHGVSYGLTYRCAQDTTLALVPIGYADGIPRAASSVGVVELNGQRFTIAGRVAMDQFVLDVGDLPVLPGDAVTVFGGTGPSANEFAAGCGTIGYEIVTRIGPRVPRRYLDADHDWE